MVIHGVYKFSIGLRHIKTGVEIPFPEIHVVIEKLDEGFGAFCLEYSKFNEAPVMEEAVAGLLDTMFEYFRITIKTEGREFLYKQCKSRENEKIWAALREYDARRHDKALEFYEKSLRGEGTDELAEKLKAHQENKNRTKPSDMDEREMLRELLRKVLEAFKELHEEYINAKERLDQFELGLEGQQEWKEEISLKPSSLSRNLHVA